MNTSRQNFVGSAALVIQDNTGISLPIEKIDEIVGDAMKDEWTEYEYDEVSPFMDTSPRETVFDLVAYHYVGRSWPCYSEKIDMGIFISDLSEKMMNDVKGFSE